MPASRGGIRQLSFGSGFLALCCSPCVAANYVVNSPVDLPDAYTPDGVCDVNGNPGPPAAPYVKLCSLRAAIDQANAHPGRDEIDIIITVPLATALPVITDSVTIQSGGTNRATIQWLGAGNTPDALVFTSSANVLRRLEILGFKNGAAIQLLGGGGSIVTDNALTNNQVGVFVSGSPNNGIGAAGPGGANVIAGNDFGILIRGTNARGNRIVGNLIGVDAGGTMPVPNGTGISVEGADQNLIGVGNDGNIVSGNKGIGIAINNSTGTKIVSNRVGTDLAGTSRIPNGGTGILLRESSQTEIGAPNSPLATTSANPSTATVVGRAVTPAAGTNPGNIISANQQDGIVIDGAGSKDNRIIGNLIGLASDGQPLGNWEHGVRIIGGSENKVGSPRLGAGNFIGGNGRGGVLVEQAGATGNLIQNNWIGLDLTGNRGRGNLMIGVFIDGANKTVVGGTTDSARNVIASGGNGAVFPAAFTLPPAGGYPAVYIRGVTASENKIQGNILGMNRDGLVALGNPGGGILIEDASDNLIGGANDPITSSFPRNLISGNSGSGVLVRGSAQRNTVAGNYIGTDATGAIVSPLPPSQSVGVWINNASGNFIGTNDASGGNVISNNISQGVLITGVSANANVVRSNRIGVDESGMLAVPNGEAGIAIVDAPNTLVGGGTTTAGTAPGNIISGNLASLKVGAVHIQGATATGNEVRGNLIGVAADGKTPLPNGYDGVLITDGASSNQIGGIPASFGNVIANNKRAGVAIVTGQSLTDASRNSILSNLIYSNALLGIDLGLDGPTPNPKRIAAGIVAATGSGENDRRASPTLFLLPNGGWGTLEGPPNATLKVQFFGSKQGHVSGYGEGERLIAETPVYTNANGFGKFLLNPAQKGEVLSATATDDQGNTSEFSKLPCPIAPSDASAIDPALVDPELDPSARWIEPPNSPPATSATLGNRALIPLAAGVDKSISLEVSLGQVNPKPDDDLRKAFVVVTIANVGASAGAPATRIVTEQQPLDANGKAVFYLDVDEMLRQLGAAENRNFLEATAHFCYRGRVQSAKTEKVLHVLREKLVIFIPGVLGSKIYMKFPPLVGPVIQVFPTLLPTSPVLAMSHDGKTLVDVESLALFDTFLGTDIYKISAALEEARNRNNLPQVTINGRRVDYFHLAEWPYDWRLRLSEDVDALVNGSGGAANQPRSVQSLVDEFRAGNRYADDKAALVGHSTGGLIVRSALVGASGLALQNYVDRAYFLNTPFLGAPKAYSAFLTGVMDFQVGLLILPPIFRSLAPNMPVVYYLSPATTYYDERIAVDPDKGNVVIRFPKNGTIVEGKRDAPTTPARLFMDDADALVNQTSQWNQDLADDADAFHDAIGRRRPTIGWQNTLVFASARNVPDTPGRVEIDAQGHVTTDMTIGDQTVPLDSEIGDVPDYVVVRNIGPNAPDHVPAASDFDVWDQIVDHMEARDERDFSTVPAAQPPIVITPAASVCTGPNREGAIRAAELFGEGEMNARATALNYATILAAAQRPFRQGFDAVYCDGEVVAQLRPIGEECQGTLIIGEGKGGYMGRNLENILASGYGYRQGTLEWAANAALATINGSTDNVQIDVSRGYHKALEAGGPIRIEVFHSECASTYPNKKPAPPPAQLEYTRYVADHRP